MARLWTSGAELNSATSGMEAVISATGGGAVTISNATVRSGSYAYRVRNAGANGIARINYQLASSDSDKPFFARAYVYVVDAPSAECPLVVFANNSGLFSAYIVIKTDRTLVLYNGGNSIVGSPSSALALNKWYCLELKCQKSGTDAIIEARIDGSTFASQSTGGTARQVILMTLGNTYGGVNSYEFFFDDIALNDGSGSFQNSWPGPGRIIHLLPNAAGDNNQLDTASSNNYQNVDEVTPDDATTIINTVSDSAGEIDDYNITNPASTIASTATINVVQVGARYSGAGASANDSAVLRIKAASAGTVEESSAITPNSTSYTTNANTAPKNYALTLYDLRGASTSAWTPADLTSAQIGLRKSADSTNGFRLSALWLLVEYQDALIETITDDFDDNSLDSTKWLEWTPGDVSETSQQLRITSTTSASYKGTDRIEHGNLVGSYAHVEVPHVLTGLTDAGTYLQVVKDGTNTLSMYVFDDGVTATLTAEKQVGGSFTTIATDTYNSTTHRWWRIREASGTIYWEYSADGSSWSELGHSTAFDVSDVYASLFIGTESANGSTDTAQFDNFNITPAGGTPGTASPSAASVTLSAQTAAPTGAASTTPSALSLTISAPSASPSGQAIVTASVASLSLSAPSASATGQGQPTLTAPSLTASLLSPTVTGAAQVAATAASATLSAPTAQGLGDAITTVSAALLTLSAQTATGIGTTTGQPDAASLTLSVPTASATGQAQAVAAALSLVLSAMTPSPTGQGNVIGGAPSLTLTALAAQALGQGAATVDAVSLMLSVLSVSATGRASAQPSPLSLLLSLPTAQGQGEGVVDADVPQLLLTVLVASAYAGKLPDPFATRPVTTLLGGFTRTTALGGKRSSTVLRGG